MGKKKRGTRNNNSRTNNNHLNNTPMTRPEYIPVHLADIPEDDIQQYNLREIADEDGYVYCDKKSSDSPLSSKPDEAESEEQYIIDEFNSPPTTTTLSTGDTVKINGLVSASEYNGMRGVIVSELDVATNRCGVRVIGKNVNVMAIQVTNLTLERKTKKSTIGNANDHRRRHIAIACKCCNEEERLALVEQNISDLQNYDNGLASSTIYNEKDDRWLLGPRLLVSIIEKWREQAVTGFIRFFNGNTADCRAANLQFVSLRDTFLHFDDWKVDWDINLTEEEIDLVKQPFARNLLVHPEHFVTNINDEDKDVMDATNDQCGKSSPPSILAIEREIASTRLVPTTDSVHADSHSAKHIAKIMKDIRKCKKDAVKIVLTTFDAGDCDSFRLGLVDNGLIPVVLGFLSRCEHEDFNKMVNKVKGNLRTPVDWIEILVYYSSGDPFKLEIANGIQAIVRCLCNDSKRLFFMNNKYWHEAVTPFVCLVSGLLQSSDDSSLNVTAATVSNILLQNEGFLESMIHKCFWRSYRSDIVKEYESYPQLYRMRTLEAFAHKVIRNIVFVGSSFASKTFSQDGFDLLKTVAKTPVVSRSYDAECKINYVIGMIRMLKHVNSHLDRGDHFATLIMLTVCFGNDAIAEVVDLGRRCTANIDDAINITRLSYCMLLRKNAHEKVFPIDKRIAVAIISGLLEMCFDFITRFACDPRVQLLVCDAKRDELIGFVVGIAECLQQVALHQNTSKAIRDRQSLIMEALGPLIYAEKSHLVQFLDILVSIMILSKGSCSRCNKPIEWHTALFCEGCRRVAYCGKKCQKKDWRCGSHSSHCSFLSSSADMMGLTTFEVKSSINISELTGLRNNIVTSQKKLFLQHKSALFSQLLNYQDRSDYIAVFDLSNKQKPIIVEHYHVVYACPKQRKWFEDVRLPGKLICVFMSQVFNDELNEDGDVNIIHLFAIFPIPKRFQSV
jgi:hypothetical protein